MIVSRPTPKNLLLTITALFAVLVFILPFLALVAGWNGSVMEDYAILTYDTSEAITLVVEYLQGLDGGHPNSSVVIGDIRQWYSMHYLAVCQGDWESYLDRQGSHVKNPSTAVCVPQVGGYTFSLASVLAADAVPAAGEYFAGRPDYPIFDTMAPVVTLTLGISFAGLTIIALGHVGRYSRPGINLTFALLTALSLTLSSGIVSDQIRTSTNHTEVSIALLPPAYASKGFLALMWLSTGFSYVTTTLLIASMMLERKSRSRDFNSERKSGW